jgi:hypothetical protein
MRQTLMAAASLVFAAGCAAGEVVPTRTIEVPTLPGPGEELPDGVAEGASWSDAEALLPPGIDLTGRYPDELAASIAVTEPFGRRPVPEPGVVSTDLSADEDEMRILITYPRGGDSLTWGEQFLIVMQRYYDGWGISQAWMRRLCIENIDHGECVGP